MHGLFSIFAEGQKYVESFFAVVADKVISWHKSILPESVRRWSLERAEGSGKKRSVSLVK